MVYFHTTFVGSFASPLPISKQLAVLLSVFRALVCVLMFNV